MGMELFKVWSGLKRTGLACLVAAMLLSLVPANGYAVPASVSPTAPPDASSGKARVEQRVRRQIAAKGEATFWVVLWVVLRSTADLRGSGGLRSSSMAQPSHRETNAWNSLRTGCSSYTFSTRVTDARVLKARPTSRSSCSSGVA